MRRTLLSRSLAIALCIGSVGCRQVLGFDDPVVVHDAGVDAAIKSRYGYVMASYVVPTNQAEAKAYGHDLDGDTNIDNQLGIVLGSFATMGFALQSSLATAVSRGDILQLIGIETTDFTTGLDAQFSLYRGQDAVPAPCVSAADPECRQHLDGDGRFTIDPSTARPSALVGTVTNGTYVAGPGTLTLPVMVFGTPAAYVPLIGARVRAAAASATEIKQLDIGGAVTMAEIEATLIPGIALQADAIIRRDCQPASGPPCGCQAGSQADELLELFDTGTPAPDCAISSAEIRSSNFFQSLLVPDVVIDEQQAISVGVRTTAVKAIFTVE